MEGAWKLERAARKAPAHPKATPLDSFPAIHLSRICGTSGENLRPVASTLIEIDTGPAGGDAALVLTHPSHRSRAMQVSVNTMKATPFSIPALNVAGLNAHTHGRHHWYDFNAARGTHTVSPHSGNVKAVSFALSPT